MIIPHEWAGRQYRAALFEAERHRWLFAVCAVVGILLAALGPGVYVRWFGSGVLTISGSGAAVGFLANRFGWV